MKVVLITGGARGIGAATARELASRGWTPVLVKTYPVERAARDIADGFDRRARRICTPGFVRAAHVLRAALTTRPFERDLVRAAPDIERLFTEQAAELGPREASVSERTAARLP